MYHNMYVYTLCPLMSLFTWLKVPFELLVRLNYHTVPCPVRPSLLTCIYLFLHTHIHTHTHMSTHTRYKTKHTTHVITSTHTHTVHSTPTIKSVSRITSCLCIYVYVYVYLSVQYAAMQCADGLTEWALH